jgi:hypothetical protein
MTLADSSALPARWRRAVLPLLAAVALSACSANRAYDTAFSSKTALTDNSHAYSASAQAVFGAAKLSLVQQGFEIEQVDAAEGLLKGMRTFDDPKNPQIAYLVSVTADVTAATPGTTVLTAAATQKTMLNREIHKYYHLLGIVPIPTGREYQSVVRAEGDITGASFYQDLFAAVSRNIAAYRTPGADAALPAAPAPLQAAPARDAGSATGGAKQLKGSP